MQRRIPTVCAALSLLLAIWAVALWVRSYSGSDSVSRRRMTAASPRHIESRGEEVQWTLGQVRFLIRRDTSFFPGRMTPEAARPRWSCVRYGAGHLGWEAPPARSVWSRLGFAAWETGWTSSFADAHDRVWAVPAWLPVVVLAVPPAAWACEPNRRRRLARTGRCPTCGYDLRVSPDRCPECGTNDGAGRAQE